MIVYWNKQYQNLHTPGQVLSNLPGVGGDQDARRTRSGLRLQHKQGLVELYEIAVGGQDVRDATVLVSRNRCAQLHHLDQAERFAPLDLGTDLEIGRAHV